MVQFAIGLVLVVIGILLFAKFHNSKGIDKLTHDLTSEETQDVKKTPELISDAQQCADLLTNRVKENEDTVKKVEADTESINKFKGTVDDEAPEGGE